MVKALLFVTALTSLGAAHGDDLRREVETLVRQLDAPRLAAREAAEETLLAIGPEALAALPEPGPQHSAETRQRLARVRQALQAEVAAQAARASRVTLRGEGMPLAEVFEAIERQTGNRIARDRRAMPPAVEGVTVDADWEDVPFWTALDEALDQAELTVYPFAEEDEAVTVVPRFGEVAPRSGRAVVSGPFRLEVLRVSATRSLRDSDEDSLRIVLEVAWEPRLNPISLRQAVADVAAVDDAGRPLAFRAPGATLEVPVNRRSTAVELNLPLALPERDVRSIAELRGSLAALLPGAAASFRFAELPEARNVEQRIGETTVTLEEIRRNNDLWEVRMAVRFDEAGVALESHRGWIYDNPAILERADGEPLAPLATNTTRRLPNEIGLAYLFPGEHPIEESTFVYRTPTALLPAAFDYEFTDVPLP